MEALIILLAEFLTAPIIGATTVLANGLFSLLSAILELIFDLLFSGSSKNKKSKIPKQKVAKVESKPEPVKIEEPAKEPIKIAKKKTNSLFLKRIKRFSLYLLILVITIISAINFLFLDPTVKWIFAKIQSKTGIELSVTNVSGNLFAGKIQFDGLKVKRESAEKSSFDFEVGNASADIKVSSLIFQPVTINSFVISDVSGKVHQPISDSSKKDSSQKAKHKGKIKSKRDFIIEELDIKNINILLSKGNNEPIKLSLNNIESAPLRSKFAVFDVFFRSNISGSINDNEFLIKTAEIPSGRSTTWSIEELPVAIFGSYIGKPPLNWFSDGKISLKFEDRWTLDGNADINTNWNFQFKDVELTTPDNMNIIERTLAKPIISYINSKDGNIDINFSLVLNENEFEHSASLDASGLMDKVVSSIISKITTSKTTDTEVKEESKEKLKDKVKDKVKDKIDGFKGFLNRKRQEDQ